MIILRGLMSVVLVYGALALGMVNSAMAEDHSARSTVESANKAWNQALNSGNAKALAALYAKNATLSPGNGKTLVGHTEIENLFNDFVKNGVHNHTLEIVDVGASGKLFIRCRSGAPMVPKPMVKRLFRRDHDERSGTGADGKWLVRSHVWNAGN